MLTNGMELKSPWILNNIHRELHGNPKIVPEPVNDYYRGITQYSFTGELVKLRNKLKKVKYKGKKEYIRILFIGLCNYYLGNYRQSVYDLKSIKNPRLIKNLYPLIIQIISNYRKSKIRILIIVSYDNRSNYNFRKLKKYGNTRVYLISDLGSFEKLIDVWDNYDQVFLFGHGEESQNGSRKGNYIVIGKTKLTPSRLETYFKTGILKCPDVLGIFSCGNGFNKPNIYNRVNYFITDNESSVPEFAEMFITGYLADFFYNWNVINAFRRGTLATVFRAVHDPTLEIFIGGRNLLK